MSDLIRAWTAGAAVYLLLNLALTFVLPYRLYDVFLLCPFAAAVVSSAVHLWKGKGGWGRHLLAAFVVPVAMEAYFVGVHDIPDGHSVGEIALGTVSTLVVAALGLGVVHAAERWVFSEKAHS